MERITWITGLTLATLLLCCPAAHCNEAGTTGDDQRKEAKFKAVTVGADGRLVYNADAKGNLIPDFSHAGYKGGGVPIPDVPVKITLEPSLEPDEDDQPRIQAALDRLAAMKPDETGFRGALLLKQGRYRLRSGVKVPADGIVVRGEGQFEDGTVIRGWGGKFELVFNLEGSGEGYRRDIDPRDITDDYVPAGSRTFSVTSTDGYKVGDRVVVVRPATQAWLAAVGGNKVNWNANYSTPCERVITGIDGKQVTVEAPTIEPIDKKLGPGQLCKYVDPNRRRVVGVENLRVANCGQAISMKFTENAWVRRVTTIASMYSCVSLWHHTKHITVQDCAYIDPVGPIKGGYRYGFNLSGQLTLVQRCYARNGRHDFVMHSLGRGPNVFLDCLADSANADSGPHHRWSVGTLYDNIAVNGNGLTVKDAGGRGTGHGWEGAQQVFFNSIAGFLVCQKPPTCQNYCIGCKGKWNLGRRPRPQGHWESHRHRVEPRSLYLAQLEDRLGEDAVRAVTVPEQLEGTIRMKLREKLGK